MTSLQTCETRGARAPEIGSVVFSEVAATRERDWLTVYVESVSVDGGAPSIPVDHRRVRAIVHLGRLLPADVNVRAMLVARVPTDDVRREAHVARLWSAQSYGNGTYVFEGHVLESSLSDPERLKVLVEPGWPADLPPDPWPASLPTVTRSHPVLACRRER